MADPAARARGAALPISRQPIFAADLSVYGYELFFGSGGLHPPALIESLLEHSAALMRREIAEAVGERWAFLNLTREAILTGYCDRLPVENVVLEVLESVPADPDVVAELERLSSGGYRIALDDFVYRRAQLPLIGLAHIVKIDVLSTPSREVERLVRFLRPFGVRLLAEKLETRSALEHARTLGFDYFQGFILARPAACW